MWYGSGAWDVPHHAQLRRVRIQVALRKIGAVRILFAGTPDVALPSLRALVESEHEVVGVVTRAPAPKGRSKKLVPSPVQQLAEELGLPVLTPHRIGDATAEILALGPEAAAVVAYGGLIREPLLSAFPWLNLHFSLLPRWRGAAPVQRAIEAGDHLTGASVFQLEVGLDTGPVFGSIEAELDGTETSESLLADLAERGSPLLVEIFDSLARGEASSLPQVGEPTHAPRLLPEEGRIDWSAAAELISRHTRAFWSSPGTWTTLGGARMKIGPAQSDGVQPGEPGAVTLDGTRVLVGTGAGALVLDRVAPPGKQWMDASAWARGLREAVVFE